MTAILILLVLAVVAVLVATMRTLRHDRPSARPASHVDWSSNGLPSHPY
jgi:hypothetical protein